MPKGPFDDLLDTVDAGLSGLESAMGVIRNSDDSDDDDSVPDPMVIDVTPSQAKALQKRSPLPRIMDIIRERVGKTSLPDAERANLTLDLSMAIGKVLDE